MGWFALSAGMACVCFVLAWLAGGARRGGPHATIIAPLIAIPAALIIAFGVPLILTRAFPATPVRPWAVVMPVLAIAVFAVAGALGAVWWAASRTIGVGRCESCGHELDAAQSRCPECGVVRTLDEKPTLRTRIERIDRDAPLALTTLRGVQSILVLAACVTIAWLIVPTVRVVRFNRLSGSTSGTANLRSPEGVDIGDAPYTYTTQVNATILVPATFVSAIPGAGASIGLEVVTQGSVEPTLTSGEAIAPASLDLAKLIRSREDLIDFQNDLVGRTSILHLNPAQDPARNIYESFDLFAQGYWPAPDPTGKTPPAAMPAADIAKAPSSLEPTLWTIGVPTAVGMIAFALTVIAGRRRRQEPIPCES